MPRFAVRGLQPDVEALYQELLREPLAVDIQFGSIVRVRSNIFDNGEFGSSPLVEFVIQYGSAVAALGTATGVKAIYEKVRNLKNVEVVQAPEHEESEGGKDDGHQ